MDMTTRYTLTLPVSCHSVDTRDVWDNGVHDTHEIRHTLAHLFGGFTETTGYGGWLDDDGNFVGENVTVWTADSDRSGRWPRLRWYASWLASCTGEEYVYITRTDRDGFDRDLLDREYHTQAESDGSQSEPMGRCE